MKKLLIASCIVLLSFLNASANLYRCEDKDGILHFHMGDKPPQWGSEQGCEWKLDRADPPRPKKPRNKGKQWYSVSKWEGKCSPNEGPAEMIKGQKVLDEPYRVVEEKITNGKPVIVRVEFPSQDMMIRYFRTKELCDSYLAEKKKQDAAELDRYR